MSLKDRFLFNNKIMSCVHIHFSLPFGRLLNLILVNFRLFLIRTMLQKEESETANKNDSSKKLSVERVYQKDTARHILLRPDTYIGSSGAIDTGSLLNFTEIRCISVSTEYHFCDYMACEYIISCL